MKKIVIFIDILIMVYFIGPAVYFVYSIGRIEGKIRVWGKVPKLRPKLMLVYNHEDVGNCMLEVFLAAMPFYWQIFWHPSIFIPYVTIDGKNFTEKWYWFWLRARAIAINRGNHRSRTEALREMIRVLIKFKGILMHFFEGGRTRNGLKFVVNENGRRLRKPPDSVGLLARAIKARVLPVCITNHAGHQQPTKKLFDWPRFNAKPIDIIIGEVINPCEFSGMDNSEVTQKITQRMFNLMDAKLVGRG